MCVSEKYSKKTIKKSIALKKCIYSMGSIQSILLNIGPIAYSPFTSGDVCWEHQKNYLQGNGLAKWFHYLTLVQSGSCVLKIAEQSEAPWPRGLLLAFRELAQMDEGLNPDNWGQSWPQTDRMTDRQTNSLSLFTGVCGFFLSVKFATSLLASLAGG